jgi:hypothetical protein
VYNPGVIAGLKWRYGVTWGRACVAVALLTVLTPQASIASSRHASRREGAVSHSNSFTFMKRDASCVEGPLVKIEPKLATVRAKTGIVSIARQDLLRVSQNEALVFTARSSWADVEGVHLRLGEAFRFKLRKGPVITGRPVTVDGDGFRFKRFLWWKKRYAKDQIATVDYLRVKPDSEVFDYFTDQSPALLFFYPEEYDRLKGLEGRIPVRLYDATKREDDSALQCSGL